VSETSTISELKKGLAETQRYLLSHHEPSGYHRCYALQIRGRTVRLCARCSGVYPGIAVGLGLFVTSVLSAVHLLLIAVLPVPALVDWTVTHFRPVDGWNSIRTLTGFLLGTGYGLGLGHLLLGGELLVLAIGVCYALLAGVALAVYHGVIANQQR